MGLDRADAKEEQKQDKKEINEKVVIMKRHIKNSILGALLLPAMLLSGCKTPNKPNNPNQPDNNKSTNGVEHSTQEDDAIRLVIESVTVNGKPASDEQRQAIVPYTGNPDDIGLIQVQHWAEIKGIPIRLKFYAKPGAYLRDFGYRYTKEQEYTRVPMNVNTYKSTDPLKLLISPEGRSVQEIPTGNAVENAVYVTIDYRNLNEMMDFPRLDLANAGSQKPFSSSTALYDRAIAILRIAVDEATKNNGLAIIISISDRRDHVTTIPTNEIIRSVTLLEELQKLTKCAKMEQASQGDPYKKLSELSPLYSAYEKARYRYFIEIGYDSKAYRDVAVALETCIKELESLSRYRGADPSALLQIISTGNTNIDYSRLKAVATDPSSIFPIEDCTALENLIKESVMVLREQHEIWKKK
ncbi:MAG: hypothetical protein PUG74_05045 [Prevotellaceae bacterium]|nr:hypothetical protein [Prevotellaceae bacterium]